MKKKQLKALRAEAATINPENHMRQTHEIHWKLGQQLIDEDEITQIDGKPVDPKVMYKVPYPVKIAINHERKLKKLVRQFGPKIIRTYMEAVKIAEQRKKVTT